MIGKEGKQRQNTRQEKDAVQTIQVDEQEENSREQKM
jgi:hypothetical protein